MECEHYSIFPFYSYVARLVGWIDDERKRR